MAKIHTSQLVLEPDASHHGFSTENSVFGVWQDLQRRKEIDKVCFSVEAHGRTYQLAPRSYFVFHRGNPSLAKLRCCAVWITEAVWFDWLVLLVVGVNCALLTQPTFYRASEKTRAMTNLNIMTAIFFVVEFLLRTLARGLCGGGWAPEPPYMREYKNWLDVFVVIALLIDLITDRTTTDYAEQNLIQNWGGTLVALRACHVLKWFKGLKSMPHMRLIIMSLSNSTTQMLHWSAIVLFMFTVFAVAGQSLFGTTLWNRCRLTPEPVVYPNGTSVWEIDFNQDRFCGGRYQCAEGTYCGSPVTWEDGVTVSYDVWAELLDNPSSNFGFTGFHSFWSSCLSLLQVATMEGWTELLYDHQDGAGNAVSLLFFCSLVSFTGLVLMNLLLAILWNSFLRAVREDTKTWRSIQSTDHAIPEEIRAMKMHILVGQVSELEAEQARLKVFKQLDAENSKAKGLKNICYTIAANKYFPRVMNSLIIVNAVCLSLDCHPPLEETVTRLSEKVNMICTIAFTLEVVLKLIGLGVDFFDDGFNKFDCFCVVASLVEMFMDGSSSVSALRTARLLRLLKMMKMQVSIRVLFRVLKLATAPTLNFSLIAFVMIFSTAVLGLHVYNHNDFNASGTTELSFDNLTWSLITVFTLLSCERWSETMYNHVRADGAASGLLFFVITLSVGNLVLMNLFLGIFASMFTCSREEILVEYRFRLVELRAEVAEMTVKPSERPPPDTEEVAEESPRFPGSLKLGKDMTCAKDMHILKMIRLKKAARSRMTAEFQEPGSGNGQMSALHGSPTLKSRLSQKYGMLTEQDGLQAKAVEVMTAARKSVTFVRDAAPADSEAAKRPQVRQLEHMEHAAAPPGSGAFPLGSSCCQVTSCGSSSSKAPAEPRIQQIHTEEAPSQPTKVLSPPQMVVAGQRTLQGQESRESGVDEQMPEKRPMRDNPHLRKRRAAMQQPSFKELFQQARALHDAIDAAVARDRCNGTTTGEYIPPSRGRPMNVIRAESCKLLRVQASPMASSSTRLPSPTPSPFETIGTERVDEEFRPEIQDTELPPRRLRSSLKKVPTFDPFLRRAEPSHMAAPPFTGDGSGLNEALGSPMSPLSPAFGSPRGPPCPPAAGSADRLATAVAAAVAAAEEAATVTAPWSRSRSRSPGEAPAVSSRWRHQLPPLVLPPPAAQGQVKRIEDVEEHIGVSSSWRQEKLKLEEPSHGASPHSTDAPFVEFTASKENEYAEKPTRTQIIGQRIALSRWFEPGVLVMIMISSLCLALESPFRSDDDPLSQVIAILDLFLTIAFFGEMVVKMMAFGVCCKRHAPKNAKTPTQPPYFAMGWNWIDFIAVVSGVMDFTLNAIGVSNPALRNMRTFRLVRVLRPLRLMKRFIGIRLLVEALISSLPTLANMTVIAALFYLGFGILFVSTLKGSLGACDLDPDGRLRPDIIDRKDCVDAGGVWVNDAPNFDHLGQSLLVLAYIGTGEGWIEVVLKVSNSVGIDMQPRPAARLHLAALVMVFVAISNFFLLNLFIGVLVDQYMATKGELTGTENLNVKEQIWMRMQKDIFMLPRSMNKTDDKEKPHTVGCRDHLESPLFTGTVFICIMANTVLLCLSHPTQSEAMRRALAIGGNFFLVIFVLEAAFKIYVLRGAYFRNPWDLFDFFITAVSCASGVANAIPALKKTGFAQILDVFRVGRTLRLGRLSYLRPMSRTIWNLLPGLMNVIGLLMLVFFIYSCLGVGLFGTLADGEILGDAANFHSLGMALLTLARAATGESWHLLMREAMQRQPGCTDEEQAPDMLNRDGPRGCGTWLALPFFLSFSFVVAVVLMNLVVAIVLDGFYAVEQVERLVKVREHTALFEQLWREAGPDEDGALPLNTVIDMFQDMGAPFGFSKTPGVPAKRWEVMCGMRRVPILDKKRIHIRDIMVLCASRAFVWTIGGAEGDAVRLRLDRKTCEEWYASFPEIPGRYYEPSEECHPLQLYMGHAFVASVLSSKWAARKAKKGARGQLDTLGGHQTGIGTPLPTSPSGAKEAFVAVCDVQGPQSAFRVASGTQQQQMTLKGGATGWALTPAKPDHTAAPILAANGANGHQHQRALSPLPWPPPMPVRNGPAVPEIVGNPPELSAFLR